MSEKPVDDGWRIPDELCERIEPLLPPKRSYPKGERPRMPDRRAMDAIFDLLRTGCQWKALPRRLGAASTVHDRFQEKKAENYLAMLHFACAWITFRAAGVFG